MSETDIPQQECPACGYKMDVAGQMHGNNSPPGEGDLSICMCCGSVSVFDKDQTLREPTEEEKNVIRMDPRVIEVQIVRSSVVGDQIKERHGLV